MILLIDDDRTHTTQAYLEALRFCDYKYVHEYNVDAAIIYIANNYSEIDLLILDMMMPPGNSFQEDDKDNGQRTGYLFLKKIESIFPDFTPPVIVLTHVTVTNLPPEIQGLVCQKADCAPSQLVEEIDRILRNKQHI